MTLADLNVRVGFLNDLKKGLGGIERDLRRASSNFAKAGNEIAMSLSLPLGAFAVKAVQTSAQMESLKLAMRTTFQDAGRSIAGADKELEALRKSAMAPGLEFEGAVKGSIALQNVGFSAEYSRKIVEQLANTISMSGGDPESMNRVIKQFTQMSAKGRILQEDLGILVENMPALSKLMKDTFGTANAEALRDMGVSAEEFIQKTVTAMEKLPRVSGGLANSITNMGQAVKTFLATIGDDIAETFSLKSKFEDFGKWLEGVATWFKGLSASTKEWILYVGAAVIALGPLLKVMAGVSALGAQMVGGFAKLLQGISWVTGGALNLTKAFTALSAAQKATVIGLAIAAFAAMVVVVDQLNDGLTQAGRTQKMLNDVQLEAAQSIVKERLEAERNIAIINDGTKSKDEQRAAMQRLIDTGSEYFKGLSIEKNSVQDITAAYDKYIANLLMAAKAKAAQEKIIELEKQRLDLAEQLQKKAESVKNAGAFGVLFNTAGGSGQSATGGFEAQIKEIEAYQAALAKLTVQQETMQGKSSTDVVSSPTISGKASGESTKRKFITAPDLLPNQTDIDAEIQKVADWVGSSIENKAPQVKTATEQFVHPLTAMAEQFEIIENKAAVMGDGFNPITEKINALKSAMSQLLNEGANPFGMAITSMKEQLAGLDNSLELNKQKWVEFGQTVTEQINQAIADSLATMAAGMGEMMAGTTDMKAIMASVLSGMLDMLIYVGKLAIETGIAVLGIKKALETLNPYVAIAGGIALIALASFAKSKLAGSTKKFADGGIISGPTMGLMGEYPGARSNPEVVAPLDKLQSILKSSMGGGGGGQTRIVGHTINGRDLYLMLETVGYDMARRRGG